MAARHTLLLALFSGLLLAAEKAADAPKTITCPAEAEHLPKETVAVSVSYSYAMGTKKFGEIMQALAENPNIRHLRLVLPNSSHVKNEHLEVLRKFKHLETFDLADSRDFGGDVILKQTMAIPKLKDVKFSFN